MAELLLPAYNLLPPSFSAT